MDVDVCAVYMCAHCSQCTVYSIVLDLYWEAMLDVGSASIPLCYFHQRRAFVSIPLWLYTLSHRLYNNDGMYFKCMEQTGSLPS